MPRNRFSANHVQRDLEKIVTMITTISVKLSFLITLTCDEWPGCPPAVKRSRSRPANAPVFPPQAVLRGGGRKRPARSAGA